MLMDAGGHVGCVREGDKAAGAGASAAAGATLGKRGERAGERVSTVTACFIHCQPCATAGLLMRLGEGHGGHTGEEEALRRCPWWCVAPGGMHRVTTDCSTIMVWNRNMWHPAMINNIDMNTNMTAMARKIAFFVTR